MRIHLVTNIDNGKGLERDHRLLRALLEGWGHRVRGVHYQSPEPAAEADLVIFLEVYEPRLAERAPRRWLIPNAEWWSPENSHLVGDFDLVLCKTQHALAHFQRLTPRARFLGFTSEDRLDPGVPRARRFLHVAGGSSAKGTETVLAAWERYKIPYPLTVVSSLGWARRPRNVEFLGRIDPQWLRFQQNVARYHLCPSRYEGWGHGIHEGLSVGAAVVVPDTPVMREIDGCALRVPASPAGQQGLVQTHLVAPEHLRDAVEQCAAFPDGELGRVQNAARDAFLSERERFIANLREVLGERPLPARLPSSVVEPAPAPALTSPLPDSSPDGLAARSALVRAVRAVAAPALRGLYGGVVIVGEAAEQIAEDVVRVVGLATRVVSLPGLAELPANHACGAILSDVLAGSTEEDRARILGHARRVVKATGPLVIAEIVRNPAGTAALAGPDERTAGAIEVQISTEHVGVRAGPSP
jgi:glycosyltransferase involved in cell wall biosynthesis